MGKRETSAELCGLTGAHRIELAVEGLAPPICSVGLHILFPDLRLRVALHPIGRTRLI